MTTLATAFVGWRNPVHRMVASLAKMMTATAPRPSDRRLIARLEGAGPPYARASALAIIHGSIDRIDRLPDVSIEVIDYKTGRAKGKAVVDQSLQLSIYGLACRDALGLGTPSRLTLYFTETALRLSTTR